MNDNIFKTIRYYCQLELNDFKRSHIFKSIKKLSRNKNFVVICDIAKGEYNKPDLNKYYLSVEIRDENNQPIEIYDEGSLGYVTLLVSVDKKNRIKLKSWTDDDFIDTLNWFTDQLSI